VSGRGPVVVSHFPADRRVASSTSSPTIEPLKHSASTTSDSLLVQSTPNETFEFPVSLVNIESSKHSASTSDSLLVQSTANESFGVPASLVDIESSKHSASTSDSLRVHSIANASFGVPVSLVDIESSKHSASTSDSLRVHSIANESFGVPLLGEDILTCDLTHRRALISSFLHSLTDRRILCGNSFKRYMLQELKSRLCHQQVVIKPDGLRVLEMFDGNICVPGSSLLPPNAHSLKLEAIDEEHVAWCPLCHAINSVSTQCYYFQLRNCIHLGWDPPVFRTHAISPAYGDGSNHSSVEAFKASVAKGIRRMLSEGVLQPVSDHFQGCLTPFRAVLKKSSLLSAMHHARIPIIDDSSLIETNSIMISKKLPELKIRLTSNCTASGVNHATPEKPFSYPTMMQALSIISKGDWLAKGDLQSYFWTFPLAATAQPYFLVEFDGRRYVYTRCCFGYKLCPYYCSVWGAEMRQWILRRNISCCHYVDDWFLAAPSLELVQAHMRSLSDTFERCGFVMAPDKFDYGQKLVFCGVLIDTTTMTLRFEPIAVAGFRSQLSHYLDLINSGVEVDRGAIHHVCGKLEWFSEVVQSGRVHCHTWWSYLKHGVNLYTPVKNKLVKDTIWWLSLLKTWETEKGEGTEYKIFSISEIHQNLSRIIVVQSDMSGDDGIGYVSYNLQEPEKNISFFSQRWLQSKPNSTMEGELIALKLFLAREGHKYHNSIVIWVSDSLSGVYSVLKGRTNSADSLVVLECILDMCDSYKMLLLALWVPREENQLADFLSHLSVLMNRDNIDDQEGTGMEDWIKRAQPENNIKFQTSRNGSNGL
jgi:hypothetical protein